MANTFSPCRTVAGLSKRKMRAAFAGSFCQCNIEIRIDIHNRGFQLSAIRQRREQRFLAACQMGVCRKDARSGNKKSRAIFREASKRPPQVLCD
jgi:hypothetical protein